MEIAYDALKKSLKSVFKFRKIRGLFIMKNDIFNKLKKYSLLLTKIYLTPQLFFIQWYAIFDGHPLRTIASYDVKIETPRGKIH